MSGIQKKMQMSRGTNDWDTVVQDAVVQMKQQIFQY